MSEQSGAEKTQPQKDGAADIEKTRDNKEHELEAEQESAAAMDADVPQPETEAPK